MTNDPDLSKLARASLNKNLSYLNEHVKDPLRSHKYFGRLISMIEEHPHYDELSSVHAALIVKGGSILSMGCNSPKRNVFVDIHALHEKFTTHAEAAAILRVRSKINLRGCTMYVARLRKKDGIVANSMPCESCQNILHKYGIKKCYYTTFGGYDVLRRTEIPLAA